MRRGWCTVIRRAVVSAGLLLTFLWVSSVALEAAEGLHYRLRYPGSSPHRVAIQIDHPRLPLPQTLVIPRAIPMGYGEQHYDQFVSQIAAFGPDDQPLEVVREQGPRWRIEASGQVNAIDKLRYEVDLSAMEREILMGADASKVRADYVGILGYSIFGFIEGFEGHPIEVSLEAPDEWPVFSTLAPLAPPANGQTTASAADFYALADSQVMMGPALRVHRVEGSPPLYVAGYGEMPWSIELTARLGREALDATIGYFGDAPFPHYTMVVEVLEPLTPDHRYGFSMEHLDSATFFLGAESALTQDSPPRQLRRARYNYAHHIAHSWIPKRCSGPGYFPFSWELAPVLDTIWFSEGFGQYAAAVAISELTEDPQEFLEAVIENRFRRSLAEAPPAIRNLSTVELSRIASTRYGEDFRTGRNIFSRGGLMAAEMDAHIRAETDGQESLRNGLRFLMDWCRRHGTALDLAELPALIEEATGVDVSSIYTRWMAAQ